MSRSATPAPRNEATRSLKPPKLTTSAELTIGTAIRPSRERLRTVADGCGHKRNVERTHPQPPDPQSETGTLATHSGKRENDHQNRTSSNSRGSPILFYFQRKNDKCTWPILVKQTACMIPPAPLAHQKKRQFVNSLAVDRIIKIISHHTFSNELMRLPCAATIARRASQRAMADDVARQVVRPGRHRRRLRCFVGGQMERFDLHLSQYTEQRHVGSFCKHGHHGVMIMMSSGDCLLGRPCRPFMSLDWLGTGQAPVCNGKNRGFRLRLRFYLQPFQ